MSTTDARPFPRFATGLLVASCLVLAACGGGGGDGSSDSLNPPPEGDFEIVLGGIGTLVEGGTDALYIPISLVREEDHDLPVSVTVAGASVADRQSLSVDTRDARFEGDKRDGGVLLSLAIDVLPIRPGERRLWFVASDGTAEDRIAIDLPVLPTDAPDIYLLAGQSNMVGFSGDGTRQGEVGGADETDPSILQLNVTGNDGFEGFVIPSDFTSLDKNVRDPRIVVAEDPLHLPRDAAVPEGGGNGKDEQYIGLGLSFAKRARLASDAEVVLVPSAWSGSSFCANADGPAGHWNAGETDSAALGNDRLFARAVLRADAAIEATGGVLRGILWHQGESDSNEACAPLYADNLERLARALRTSIRADRRGADFRGPDAPIPFVAGTMSRGNDERGDFATFTAPKQQIDDAHRALPTRLAWSAVSNHDDLVPANGYPCGSGSCIHFGAAALREMGRRYHDALERAAFRPPTP